MEGHFGIGVISDRDAQPLIIGSKCGTFAIASAGLVHNVDDLASDLVSRGAALS
jgi:amidophosphoribosyltransferase